MKKIGKKNLYYSLLLAAAMMLFLIGYFSWMLPSLYIDHMQEQNLEAVKKQHQAFMAQGSYDGVQVKNPSACASVKIPLDDPYIEITTKIISIKVTAVEAEVQELLAELQELIRTAKGAEAFGGGLQKQIKPDQSEKLDQWKDQLSDIYEEYVKLPVKINFLHTYNQSQLYGSESLKVHDISDHMAVLEASVEDHDNKYTNYLAVENAEDAIVFTVLPVITPEMEEIRPVVMQSLPMLGAVILAMTLVFSQVYSGGIVQPVYKKLEDMNQALIEENKRQEVFMRASSHQLKTPITAALLLLDGMISQIGRYKDTRAYLLKVKEQLLSMRRMVEKILSLNQNRENLNICEIGLYELVQSQLAAYSVAAADKRLQVVLEGDQAAHIRADQDVLSKIIDNLLSNAVNYTSAGAQIHISVQKHSLTVWNQGAAVPQEIMEHIFEPFVRGSDAGQSHGLGLYIAAYYARLSGFGLTVANAEDGVEAVIRFAAPK